LFDGYWCHFQQYFSFIVVVSFIGGGLRETGENYRPVASHWQTLSHNVVHLALVEIQTHNINNWQNLVSNKFFCPHSFGVHHTQCYQFTDILLRFYYYFLEHLLSNGENYDIHEIFTVLSSAASEYKLLCSDMFVCCYGDIHVHVCIYAFH
jgi:hypothetical protein